MTNNSPNKISHQWMKHAGVQAIEVDWLDSMAGSPVLHEFKESQRVEQIYLIAIKGVLRSPSILSLALQQ